jgi:DNA-binding CsgD family transcriptional regulator
VNTDPVRTNLLEVDEAGNETVVGTIVLDPNDEVDVDFVEGPNGEVVLDLDVLAGSVTVTVGGQTVELTAGQPVPPLPVGAREALRGVMNALIALRSGVVDKKDETRIEAAIGDVTTALDQSLWVDVLRVQPKDGHRVFQGNEGRGHQTARAAQGQEKRASGRNLTGTARPPARRRPHAGERRHRRCRQCRGRPDADRQGRDGASGRRSGCGGHESGERHRALPERLAACGAIVAAASSWLHVTYGCTPREAALAHTLAQGRTLAEAAGALGISVHTARTHLKRVFRKTGTRRQAELLRLVLLA